MNSGLQIRHLRKKFGGLIVADDISLDLKPGDRMALIGPNGAGKTTFANLLSGTIRPGSGSIRLNGRDIVGLKESRRVKQGVAKTFQITTLFKAMSVRQNIRLPLLERENKSVNWFSAASNFPLIEQEIDQLLAQFSLEPFAEMQVQELAYGQQRLVEMALTLALKPEILILDEPSAGVPSSDTSIIINAIEKLPKNLCVLVIEHDMKLVFKVATRIVVLVNGAILVEGTPEEIQQNQQVRDLYLGGAMSIDPPLAAPEHHSGS